MESQEKQKPREELLNNTNKQFNTGGTPSTNGQQRMDTQAPEQKPTGIQTQDNGAQGTNSTVEEPELPEIIPINKTLNCSREYYKATQQYDSNKGDIQDAEHWQFQSSVYSRFGRF